MALSNLESPPNLDPLKSAFPSKTASMKYKSLTKWVLLKYALPLFETKNFALLKSASSSNFASMKSASPPKHESLKTAKPIKCVLKKLTSPRNCALLKSVFELKLEPLKLTSSLNSDSEKSTNSKILLP